MKKILLLLIVISTLLSSCEKNNQREIAAALAQENFNGYKIEIVVDNLEIAWGMAFLPDGSILISEQTCGLIAA